MDGLLGAEKCLPEERNDQSGGCFLARNGKVGGEAAGVTFFDV